mmetsp:Transcript_11950/g.22031  ORF Transcript_11950/g.22031 Transcript_11950/m.22031 type:complete len:624 (+) Transcript_11950:488-2359(+)
MPGIGVVIHRGGRQNHSIYPPNTPTNVKKYKSRWCARLRDRAFWVLMFLLLVLVLTLGLPFYETRVDVTVVFSDTFGETFIPERLSNLQGFEGDQFLQFMVEPVLPDDGRVGKDALQFKQDFIELERAKSKVGISGKNLTNNGGCDFHGVKNVNNKQAKTQRQLLTDVNIRGLKEELSKSGGRLLDVETESICSWYPRIFTPSLPAFAKGLSVARTNLDRHEPTLIASALVFNDVCITRNIDSTKMAQRAVVVVDPSNDHKLRCTPCPNPQTNFEWMTNRCGMMWFHQMNVKSLQDVQECYDKNNRLIRENGQRQVPGESIYHGEDQKIKGVVYYDEPTLLLQYTKNNPGHQLWDSLWSIITIIRSQEVHNIQYHKHVISHQTWDCPNNVWICSVLRKLGVIKEDNLLQVYPGVLTCFKQLTVPIQGWNHGNEHTHLDMTPWFTKRVQEAFKLTNKPAKTESEYRDMLDNILDKRGSKRYQIALYAHNTKGEAGYRRAWLNINDTIKSLNEQVDSLAVQYIQDFGKVSVEEQARTFYEADIIVMPHGGQFGNSIFIRENTIVVELTCGGYSHLAGNHGAFAKAAKFYHIVETPKSCTKSNDAGNFEYNVEDIMDAIRFAKTEF